MRVRKSVGLILGVGVLLTATAPGAEASPSGDWLQDRPSASAAAIPNATPGSIAVSPEADGYTAATITSITDAVGDATAGADILSAAVNYEDDVVAVGYATRANLDPLLNWLASDGPYAEFDVNGDTNPDYLLDVTGDDDESVLRGAVFDATTGIVTCPGSQLGYDWTTFYAFAFDASCIGDPASFRWRLAHTYAGSADWTPESGWGPLTVETVTAPPPPPPPPPAPQSPSPAPNPPAPAPAPGSGYWMIAANGTVYGFGTSASHGNADFRGVAAVDLEPTPTGNGYWVAAATGAVSAFGDAALFASTTATPLATGEQITAITATPTGQGYWLFSNRGRVLAYGDAVHYGDMSSVTLNGPVIGSTVTPTGQGYWMVASDGGIFTFGDAAFYGSTGALRLNQPVVGLAADPDGTGYWLVAADGGIFGFDAAFKGSMGAVALNRPVIGAVPFGNGYLMVGSDGGIFTFSQQAFYGSLGAHPPVSPIVSVAVRP